MERDYDIFEMVESGPLWVDSIKGHHSAVSKAEELGRKTSHEIRVMYLPDNAIVAVVNQRPSKSLTASE